MEGLYLKTDTHLSVCDFFYPATYVVSQELM
jgi:hypothetical protein